MRYLPVEGAFFQRVRERMAEEDKPVVKRRAATPAEIAAMFGMPLPK